MTVYVDSDGWVSGDKLYRVGFVRNGFPLIRNMSGLVNVLAVAYDNTDRSVNFIVDSKDKTGTLFKTPGGLIGQQIARFRVNEQGGILIQT